MPDRLKSIGPILVVALLSSLAAVGLVQAAPDPGAWFLLAPWGILLMGLVFVPSANPLEMWICVFPFLMMQPNIGLIFGWALLLILIAPVGFHTSGSLRLPKGQALHLLLVTGIAVLGTVNAGFQGGSINKLIGTYLLPAVVYVLIMKMPQESNIERKLPVVILWAFALIGVGSALYKLQNPDLERVAGYIELSVTMLGYMGAAIVPIALHLLVTARKKAIPVLLFTFLMLAILLTNTRMALLMVLIALVVNYRNLGRFVLPMTMIGSIVAFVGIEVIFTRYAAMSKQTIDISMAARVIAWSTGFTLVSGHPWTGIGVDAFAVQYLSATKMPLIRLMHAHNTILQKAADLGIPGMLVYMVFLYKRIHQGFRLAGPGLPRALAWSLSIYLVASLTDAVFYWTSWTILYWVLLACLARFTLKNSFQDTGGTGSI